MGGDIPFFVSDPGRTTSRMGTGAKGGEERHRLKVCADGEEVLSSPGVPRSAEKRCFDSSLGVSALASDSDLLLRRDRSRP